MKASHHIFTNSDFSQVWLIDWFFFFSLRSMNYSPGNQWKCGKTQLKGTKENLDPHQYLICDPFQINPPSSVVIWSVIFVSSSFQTNKRNLLGCGYYKKAHEAIFNLQVSPSIEAYVLGLEEELHLFLISDLTSSLLEHRATRLH